MNFAQRLNARLTGFRALIVAVILAMPDVLNGLGGFDFNILAPGKGAAIGGVVALARICMIPVLLQLRRDARPPCDGGMR